MAGCQLIQECEQGLQALQPGLTKAGIQTTRPRWSLVGLRAVFAGQ
jgi:hypothetical protein